MLALIASLVALLYPAPSMAAIGSDTQHSGNLVVMSGPNAARISPDGTRFAYWLSVRNIGTCPIWDPLNCSFRDTDYTLVSHVERFTEGQEFGAVRDYRDPSWVGNDRLLVFNYGLGIKQGALARVGAGEAGLRQWFNPPAGRTQIGQGQLTRQGDKLVTLAGDDVFGPAQRELHFYGVPSGDPALPTSKCYVAQGAPPTGKFLVPSWSPEGTAVAVGESDGIHVYDNIPDLSVPDADCHLITDRVLVKGSSPAWGPADVAGAQTPPPPAAPTPPTTSTSTAKPDDGAPAKPMAGTVVATRQRGRGVRIRVRELAAGATIRVRLRDPRGALMGAEARQNAKPGTLTLTVRLNRRGRTVQLRRGALRLAVEITATAPNGAARTEKLRVTLRR